MMYVDCSRYVASMVLAGVGDAMVFLSFSSFLDFIYLIISDFSFHVSLYECFFSVLTCKTGIQ